MGSRLVRPSSATDSAERYVDAPPSTARRLASLKRSSSSAGLSQDPDQIASLKRQLNRSQSELEEWRLLHTRLEMDTSTAQRKLEAQLEEQAAKLDKAMREKAVMLGLKRDLEDKSFRIKDDHDRGRRDAEGLERLARKELVELKNQMSNVEAELREKTFAERQAKDKARSALDRERTLTEEVERLQRDLEEREARLRDERRARIRAEQDAETIKSTRTVTEESSSSAAVIRDELHRQVSHMQALEKENQRLARRLEVFEKQHVNVEVAKEANRTLERRVKAVDELVKKVAAQEVELDGLKREKLDWAAFLTPSDASEFSSPRKITRTLAATRIENAAFRQKVEQHAKGLQSRDLIIGELEKQVADSKQQVEEGKKAVAKAEAAVKQEQGRSRLLQQEIDLLKRHLDSYNTEEAIQQAGNFDAQKTARIQELEQLLEELKAQLADTAKQVNHWQEVAQNKATNIKVEGPSTAAAPAALPNSTPLMEQLRLNEALREEMCELRNSHGLLEKELEALEMQVDSFERDHGIKGAYNPETTRVLEHRDSPERMEHAIRTSTLELLRNENAALVQRISDLSSAGSKDGAAQTLVPVESLKSAEATIASLKLKVQQKETMLKRISSAMAEKTESLRLAVQDLLGFQLAFLESGRIRITSLYAPSKDRSLAFDPWPGGPMPYKPVSATDEKIMKNEEVRRSIAFWLDNRRSLPGFLASLTMTLYEESTRGASGGVVYG
ncbi:BQ2448_1199 [Microbotryum intermedium]|uniref:Spindle assembly checkpoint component MAD1 n=1 Tax=Microbotryum intermedium TaxID=269621 RepID=A0A238F9C3_9BASI|nr:BQ2448_1199 [Microbotryum intermedium]